MTSLFPSVIIHIYAIGTAVRAFFHVFVKSILQRLGYRKSLLASNTSYLPYGFTTDMPSFETLADAIVDAANNLENIGLPVSKILQT